MEIVNDVREAPPLNKLLQNNDAMGGMERLEMVITDISHPFAHVARVTGHLTPKQPLLWAKPNIAFRLEVGTQEQDRRPLTRAYTIRHFDVQSQLAQIDFVIHEGHAPAMNWLDQATRGSRVFLIGPRQHFIPDYHLSKKIAFFADDTAIPALYAMLSQWPNREPKSGSTQPEQAAVYIDCADGGYAAELPRVKGVCYHVHVRGKGQVAGKSGYLPAMAQTITAQQNGSDWQIWVACEREEARTIRQYFIDRCALEKTEIKAIGYWKYGMSASQMDHARLAHYAKLHEAGKDLKQFEEFDIQYEPPHPDGN